MAESGAGRAVARPSGRAFPGTLDPPPFPIVDVHVHLGPSDTGEIYYPHLRGEEYLGLMREAAVERAAAFAPMRNDGYRFANQELLQWCASTEGRVVPFARIGGERLPVTEAELWMVRRKLRRRLPGGPPVPLQTEDLAGFAGVKMLPHLDGLPSPELYAQVRELELPVLIHAGRYSTPRWIEREVLPNLRTPLILAHLGSFPCDARLLQDAVDLAARVERVYLDTSGVCLAGFLRYAVERVPEKLLFGSDCPLTHPRIAWEQLSSVVEDERTLLRIGRETALGLLGLGGSRGEP